MSQPTSDEDLPAPEAVMFVGPGLVIRPGDRLIVGFGNREISTQQADQIKAGLRERLPGLADILLITGATQMAVYRTEDGDEPSQE